MDIYSVYGKVLAGMGSFTSEIPVFINLFSSSADHKDS